MSNTLSEIFWFIQINKVENHWKVIGLVNAQGERKDTSTLCLDSFVPNFDPK